MLHAEMFDILKKEEQLWFQCSRAKWLVKRDRNTKYHHFKVVQRRRQNHILMIKGEARKLDWEKTPYSFHSIELETKEELSKHLTRREIKQVLFYMSPWKAPGPDVFMQVSIKDLGILLAQVFVTLS
ncbi:unnamed protein product [Lathyrus sativus]|nr:unnamed protein product [Lathyrus sativus]